MRGFSELIDKLLLTSSRNRKIDILCDYFKSTPDPDRGFALAIITNSLELKNIPISKIKEIVRENVDEELFALSYDYVGDLAETISLIWPYKENGHLPQISKMISILKNIKKDELSKKIQTFLSIANETERWALIKLISGGLRIGVSSRLAKTALAKFGNKELNDIEKIDSKQKHAIVFGNEIKGVDQKIIDISENTIEIDQYGTKHSLNVSVAAGIVIWKFYNSLT